MSRRNRVRAAWQGHISDCLLGKPLEVLCFREELAGVRRYLHAAGAMALRDYVPLVDGAEVARAWLWIGAQIRADLYGRACPGQPSLAAALARRDAGLSHRGEGVQAAAFVAALTAAIPASGDADAAVDRALEEIPGSSLAAAAARFGRSVAGSPDAVSRLHQHDEGLSPVHAINDLGVVVWAICSCGGDFSTAIGDAVSAGWDTDCNGATVGGLWELMGMTTADRWTVPWNGRVGVGLAGHSELRVDDPVDRTVAVARRLES